MKPYRECVVAVIVNGEGKVLAGERSDKPGVWQLPQGGIDPGETAKDALFRELKEEIGCNEVEIIAALDEKVSYDFPEGLKAKIVERYRGQVQDWFLLRFKPQAEADMSAADGEFRQVAWKTIDDLVTDIVHWKKAAYEKGFQGFNLH